jgi:hypothetical protein
MRTRSTSWLVAFAILATFAVAGRGESQAESNDALAQRAEEGMLKAIRFLHSEVSTEGGYLWRYSEDLSQREGERKATSTQAWVQPPGTPTVGLAFVEAYEATRNAQARTAMLDAADALIRGQNVSGGWGPHIEFDPAERSKYAYRVDRGSRGAIDITSLDDNTTQSAVQFLMRADKALEFKNGRIHESAAYALRKLMEAQYANGAWPHKFGGTASKVSGASNAKAVIPRGSVKPWDRHGGGPGQFTFNDHGMDRMIELFLAAGDIYNKPEYREVAEKTGDFILQAQFPEPQPGWAQQYDDDMSPAWARRFEPPSLATSETQGLLDTLMLLYERTGREKYLDAVPKTLAWLRRSQLPGGRLPRFIEFRSNRPLYVDSKGSLTNDAVDLFPNYQWNVGSDVERMQKRYDRLVKQGPSPAQAGPRRPNDTPNGLIQAVRQALADQDERGRWVENGVLRAQGEGRKNARILNMATFARNITALAKYVAYARNR